MDDLSIEKVFSSPFGKMAEEKAAKENSFADFKKILTESVGEVNQKLLQASEDAEEMIAGKKDIHQAMISLEEGNISMRLLLQVRNRIIAAYQEIMRMQF